MANLRQSNGRETTRNRNLAGRSTAPICGLCAGCADGCEGNCEFFQGTFRGREVIYREPFVEAPANCQKACVADYSHLSIQRGYDVGRQGSSRGGVADGGNWIFPAVNVETEYGWEGKVRMAAPMFLGVSGANDIARKNWEHFAVGAALGGVTVVCGENVCGADPRLEMNGVGNVKSAPELDRRIQAYRRYHRGFGEFLLQVSAEDRRLGVAEYVLDKHGVDSIELKWDQAARCTVGDDVVNSFEQALALQRRGNTVMPDPANPTIQAAYENGAIDQFEVHRLRGFVDQAGFSAECDRLRQLGFKRITLKVGVSGMTELALAMKWGSDAKVDLLTIDGTLGAATVPRRTAGTWGTPNMQLHSASADFAARFVTRGKRPPHLALAGGFGNEDSIFKALALGAPFVKAVCMGQALMVPGMLGKNVGVWMENGGLPPVVRRYGKSAEEIFVCWEEVADLVGKDEVRKVPLGAIGIYSYLQKAVAGLQRLMAEAGCFNLASIAREGLASLTRDCADVTRIPYIMDAQRDRAEAILDGGQ